MKPGMLCSAAVAAVLLGTALPSIATAAGPAPARRSANLLHNAGAEHAKPDASGGTVPVPGWKVTGKSRFTAVRYGTPAFPDATSPRPDRHGDNFFAGGEARRSTASQVVSLTSQHKRIRSGHARFVLSGWLGGFSTQADAATLKVRWRNGHGKSIGKATRIGPVTRAQREGVTGLLFREAEGTVPRKAASAKVTVTFIRHEGSYNDGYADALSLHLR